MIAFLGLLICVASANPQVSANEVFKSLYHSFSMTGEFMRESQKIFVSGTSTKDITDSVLNTLDPILFETTDGIINKFFKYVFHSMMYEHIFVNRIILRVIDRCVKNIKYFCPFVDGCFLGSLIDTTLFVAIVYGPFALLIALICSKVIVPLNQTFRFIIPIINIIFDISFIILILDVVAVLIFDE